MLTSFFRSNRRAQAMLEYMLLMGIVAFIVFLAFRPKGGILKDTQMKAQGLYQAGSAEILK